MFDKTQQQWGRVDVLVHNALIPFDVTSFADLSWEQLGGKLDREMHAAFLITKAVAPGIISRRYSRLVYLSTGLSRQPREGMIALGTAIYRKSGRAEMEASRFSFRYATTRQVKSWLPQQGVFTPWLSRDASACKAFRASAHSCSSSNEKGRRKPNCHNRHPRHGRDHASGISHHVEDIT